VLILFSNLDTISISDLLIPFVLVFLEIRLQNADHLFSMHGVLERQIKMSHLLLA